MSDRVKEIRERAEKASKGPWVHNFPENKRLNEAKTAQPIAFFNFVAAEIGNVDFIAHAREDVPYLLDRLAAKDAELARLGALLDAAVNVAKKAGAQRDDVMALLKESQENTASLITKVRELVDLRNEALSPAAILKEGKPS